MNFRPLLITSNAEEIIQAWEESEKLNPWPRVINIVMLLLLDAEKQLLAISGTKALRL